MVQAVSFKIGNLVRVKDVVNSDGWLGHIVKKDASWGSFYGVTPVRNLEKVLRVHVSDLIHAEVLEKSSEAVTKPAHYDLPGGIQVIDLIRGESFLRGNLLKYVFRAPHKGNELEDLKKAAEYLKWEIERVEAK